MIRLMADRLPRAQVRHREHARQAPSSGPTAASATSACGRRAKSATPPGPGSTSSPTKATSSTTRASATSRHARPCAMSYVAGCRPDVPAGARRAAVRGRREAPRLWDMWDIISPELQAAFAGSKIAGRCGQDGRRADQQRPAFQLVDAEEWRDRRATSPPHACQSPGCPAVLVRGQRAKGRPHGPSPDSTCATTLF